MLKKGYYYLFYKIHKFTSKLGNYDVAFSSILGLSGMFLINIITIVLSIDLLEKVFTPHYKLYFFILGWILTIMNYFLFVYKDKYKEIEKEFINETKRQKVVGDIIVSAYVVLSFILLFEVIGL